MKWQSGELKNPFSGKSLRRDSPHSFTDGGTRFPVIAEIPYLRAGRETLREAVLAKLDGGDEKRGVNSVTARSGRLGENRSRRRAAIWNRFLTTKT